MSGPQGEKRGGGGGGGESGLLLELLGDKLVTAEREEVDVQSLCSRVTLIGLLFGCGVSAPCQQLLPGLTDFYCKTRERLEIVFISSDPDQKKWQLFLKDMPWLALPYQEKHKKVRRTGGEDCHCYRAWLYCVQGES